MKKLLASILVLTLVLALAASASADPTVLYAAHNDVPVYADRNTSSTVLKHLQTGDSVLIEDSKPGWYATLVQDPSGEGQTLGWIQAADLSTTAPCVHSWGSWVVQKEATCTQKGLRVRTCTLCGEKESQEIDMIPHSYGGWVVRREATCTPRQLEPRLMVFR